MFEELELDHRLRLGLDGLALEQATVVQQQTVPLALAGNDLLVGARTGSGKTLAYLIPVTQRLLTEEAPRGAGTLALVLVPTRELARQVMKDCRALVEKSPLRVQAITGGADFKYQAALFRRNPEIIIATPERLLEHCRRRTADLSGLKVLVLDEADRMLDFGFRDSVLEIADLCPPTRQVLLLSATLGHRRLQELAGELLRDATIVNTDPIRAPHRDIEHQRILADSPEHKDRLLLFLADCGDYPRILVFTNRRTTADRLGTLLQRNHLKAGCLHGELSTEERKRVVAGFTAGKLSVLCASDVAARGLDLREVDLVINYDVPRTGRDYLHRTGRTGRAGRPGVAISLVTAQEWNLMISIQRYLGLELTPRALPGLKARYSGPKKVKGSGKAAGSGKKSTGGSSTKRKPRPAKSKKARGPAQQAESNDGMAPLMRSKRGDR